MPHSAGESTPLIAHWRRWARAHPLIVDFVLAALLCAVALGIPGPPAAQRVLAPVDLSVTVLCLAGGASLVVRRRYPWPVWLWTTAIGIVGVAMVGGPSRAMLPVLMAVYTLSTKVSTRQAVGATVLTPLVPFLVILIARDIGPLEAFAFGLGPACGLAAVTGIAVRIQRAVIAAANERARLAEENQDEEARRRVSEERLRIARDLHDVIAHHTAVITVQAGVASRLLTTDPAAGEVALGHVRDAGRSVLQDIPGLLGLLRSDDEAFETAPAPRLADVADLVDRARRSGLQVTLRTSGRPTDLGSGPELTAYRMLQEGLTNAARHGVGAAVLTVTYDAQGCLIELRNRRAVIARAGTGGGHGLTGMAERAASTGGDLVVGPDGTDERLVRYRVDARPVRKLA